MIGMMAFVIMNLIRVGQIEEFARFALLFVVDCFDCFTPKDDNVGLLTHTHTHMMKNKNKDEIIAPPPLN